MKDYFFTVLLIVFTLLCFGCQIPGQDTSGAGAQESGIPEVHLSTVALNPTATYPIPVFITFSKPVTDFIISDITVNGGSLDNFSGSGSLYTVDITPTGAPDVETSVTVTVDIDADICMDTDGNGNTAATQLIREYDNEKIGFENNQDAMVVFGQPDFTSHASNQGGSVGPNTFAQSFGRPEYVNGKLFLPDYGNNRVLVFNSIPITNNASADYAIGQTDLSSNSSGLSSSTIHGPESVSSNGTELVFVDYNNNRILLYNLIPTSSGAEADVVIGQTDFGSKGSDTTAASVKGPESVFITSDKLFIADSINNRVLIYNSIPTSNGAAASIVLGQLDFTSKTSGTSADTLKNPTDVWSDGTRLLVSDAGNHRILIWNTFPTVNGQAADVVVGQTDFSGSSAGLAADKFHRQWNFTVSAISDQLIVTDLDNHRVLIFNTIPTENGASADAVLGQADFTSKVTGCSETAINWPCGVAVLDSTRILMIDANNYRALIFEGL